MFADDIVPKEESHANVETYLESLQQALESKGLTIIRKKTECRYMVF